MLFEGTQIVDELDYSYYEALNAGDANLGLDFFKPSLNAKPPTIMQVLPSLNSGGVERGTLEISKALITAGWKSIVVSQGGSMVNQLKNEGGLHVELAVGSKNPINWFSSYRQLKDIILKYEVDLVHARSRMPAWLALNATKAVPTHFITTFHGRHNDTNRLKKFYNSVMTRGEKTIAISSYIASEIITRHQVNPKKLYIIPRGVDPYYFNQNTVSRERINKLKLHWGVPDNIPIIMLPGRVTRWKGHELLIKSLVRLHDLSFFCIFVGPYDDKKKFKTDLEHLIRKNNLVLKTKFVGDCADMAAAYKLSDIVISASLDPEPFGRTIIEAQAMGKIVLASKHGGAIESIVEGKTGWLFEPCNSIALSDRLRNALNIDDLERSTVSNNAEHHIRKNFSTEEMCARTLSVYTEVLGFNPIGNNN